MTQTPLLIARYSRAAMMVTCLGAAILSACGGGSGGSQSTLSAATPAAATAQNEVALVASTPGTLTDYFRQKIKQDPSGMDSSTLSVSPLASPLAAATSASAEAPSFSGTTLQESSVDENDWIKTDGSLLYSLAKAYSNGSTATTAQLQTYQRQESGQLTTLGTLALTNDLTYAGMYLVSGANRLALIGQRYQLAYPTTLTPITTSNPIGTLTTGAPVSQATAPSTTPAALSIAPITGLSEVGVDLVATTAASTSMAKVPLSVVNRIRIDGNLVGSRVIGSTLYVVSSWAPDLSKFRIPASATPAQADAVLAKLTSGDILPKIRIDSRPSEPLVAETDCYLQTANASPSRELTTITAFDLASPTLARSSRCFLGGSQALYVSPAAVYVTSSRYVNNAANTSPALAVLPANAKTDVHKFALTGMSINYRGSVEVNGHLGWEADKNAYRMSEYLGDLRILTFTGQQGWSTTFNGTSTTAKPVPAASPATLTILRESGNAASVGLQVVSTLPNASRPAAIGKTGEQIYAVRYVGAKAYAVTFRRTDPLYVMDLSNPADPKITGELEIPGYSDYLYPLGADLLLGVGKDANDGGVVQGVKVALINVADPSRPALQSSVNLGNRGSVSALDISSRGISIYQQGTVFRIGLPVRLNQTPIPRSPGFFGPTVQGLARFEVDTRTKAMATLPMVPGLTYPTNDSSYSLAYGQYDMAQERSLQIESFVYYFTGGSFLVKPW